MAAPSTVLRTFAGCSAGVCSGRGARRSSCPSRRGAPDCPSLKAPCARRLSRLRSPDTPLFRSGPVQEMTRKVSAEGGLVHQQTQNQRYGSSHIGATAKDISNVVTDAASGVVDSFHGIDRAVADTWNNFWKDGKADGIGSNLSRK